MYVHELINWCNIYEENNFRNLYQYVMKAGIYINSKTIYVIMCDEPIYIYAYR